MKYFFEVFFSTFIMMVCLAATVVPLALFMSGIWPAWTLWSYFITIPADVGLMEVFFNA